MSDDRQIAVGIGESLKRAEAMIRLVAEVAEAPDPSIEAPAQEAWAALVRLDYADPEDALRVIASALRAGEFDPLFVAMLADLIDPDVAGTKLKVAHPTAGKPPPEDDLSLTEALYVQVRLLQLKQVAAFSEAEIRFGVKRSTCQKALKKGDRLAQTHPHWAEFQARATTLIGTATKKLRVRGVDFKTLRKKFFPYI